jgi:hypothetical protein
VVVQGVGALQEAIALRAVSMSSLVNQTKF